MVRLGLRGVHQVGKLHPVLNEKNGNVVSHEVPVALVGVELDGKAANVADGIGRATLAQQSREENENGGSFARSPKERCARQRAVIVVAFEVAVGTRAARMNDSLGNALMIEMSDLLAKDEVLEERRAA